MFNSREDRRWRNDVTEQPHRLATLRNPLRRTLAHALPPRRPVANLDPHVTRARRTREYQRLLKTQNRRAARERHRCRERNLECSARRVFATVGWTAPAKLIDSCTSSRLAVDDLVRRHRRDAAGPVVLKQPGVFSIRIIRRLERFDLRG